MTTQVKNSINDDIVFFKKINNLNLKYSVSGLRNKNHFLDSVIFRLGLLAAIRSAEQNGNAIGVMITASHNPSEDNGIKIIDPKGEMLDKNWILLANELINLEDNQVEEWILNKLKELNCERNEKMVFLGMDTRESSVRLIKSACKGVKSINGQVKSFGLLTTPQLHFIVNAYNNNIGYEPSEQGYYNKISSAFTKLNHNLSDRKSYETILNVDCANGVGANKLSALKDFLGDDILKIKLYNSGQGILNDNCGADFVKIEQKCPQNIVLSKNEKYVSLDGDADRLIYFYLGDKLNKVKLIDGDKISVLFAIYLNKILKKLNISNELDLAIIQTAYANGGSTKYIEEELKIEVHCVPTGVLNLHEKACEYDIGIYFEANGHGTVIFSKKTVDLCKSLIEKGNLNAQEFLNFIDLINQTTGDAISDLITVEYILRYLDWTIDDWSKVYEDLPQRQLKVTVKDRTKIKLTKDECKCVEPEILQLEINRIVKKYVDCSRSFVRPSQTEDIVRIYAESDSQQNADNLANEIAELVKKIFT